MKKLLLIILPLLIACAKVNETSVVFRSNIEVGDMTKADHNAIKSLIASTYPSNVRPVIHYGDETQYITLGTPMTVRIGDWSVTYNYSPQAMAEVMTNSNIANAPALAIDTEVNIRYGTSEYNLPMLIRSAGFAIDKSEIAQIRYQAKGQNLPSTKMNNGVSNDDYTIFFVNGDLEGTLVLQVTPTDPSKKTTIFRFGNGEQYSLSYGKYYVLHADDVTEIEGTMGIIYPDWEGIE